MPDKKIIDIIKDLNKQIQEKFNDFHGCYLYGSRARGDYHKNSDIDVVAILDNIDRDKELEIYGIVSDLIYKYDYFISLMIYTPETLKRNRVFYDEVVKKGYYYGAAA